MKLSVIIPSYKDPLLFKTVESLLTNSELKKEELEIILVMDGYWASNPLLDDLKGDSRVKVLHLGKNRGMREAINAGVRISTGEYLLRTDEHCMFGPGYDRILTDKENIKDNWIVVPRRYFLDPKKWEVMDIPFIDYEKLIIGTDRIKFTAHPWVTRTKEREDKLVDETMAMQGSAWIMSRKHWDTVIGELQTEGYGPLYQDSTEMIFKTWQAGGKMMLNKKTWYAHKHRSFKRTHNINADESQKSFDYAMSVWKDYYTGVVRPLWKI